MISLQKLWRRVTVLRPCGLRFALNLWAKQEQRQAQGYLVSVLAEHCKFVLSKPCGLTLNYTKTIDWVYFAEVCPLKVW